MVSGKNRRLTFIECPNDISGMIDLGKIADLVLLMVDGSFGFEMETFEFLNVVQTHGFPRVLGIVTHLDAFKENKTLKNTKKVLKNRFWTEIYQGAKVFNIPGLSNGKVRISLFLLYLFHSLYHPTPNIMSNKFFINYYLLLCWLISSIPRPR